MTPDNLPLNTPDSLWIDTTGNRLMLGLSAASEMVWRFDEACENHRQHSAMILPVLHQAMADWGTAPQALMRVGCNIGPGSFTGIRTGLSIVRTIGQVLTECEILAFNRFELLSNPGAEGEQPITLEAQRGNVYHATLAWTAAGPAYSQIPQFRPRQLEEPLTTDNPFTPDRMLTLVTHYPGGFTCPWVDLLPLYLQPPNITLKKSNQIIKAQEKCSSGF